MPRKTKKSPGSLIAQLADLRKKISDAKAVHTELTKRKDAIDLELLSMMDDQDVSRISTRTHTASATELVIPTVTDWDKFYAFMKQEDALYMLQRRPLATAFREMLEARDGEAIPGVEPFVKRSVSLRISR